MKHTYTIATTILVDITSDEELTDYDIGEIMSESDYSITAKGVFPTTTGDANRYEITDTEMEDWTLVAAREEA